MSSASAQQIRFCTSRDGVRIAYATCGAGPPLLWIGHWVRHLEYDWDHPVWRPWLAWLTRHHTVVRYDWRGCGLSDRSNVAFSFQKHLEDCEAVVGAAGLCRFPIVATSQGGTMATAYAARHPERLSGLALYGVQIVGRLRREVTAQSLDEGETRLKMIELGWNNNSPAYAQFFARWHMPDADAAQAQAYNELMRRTTTPENVIQLLRTYWDVDVREFVPQIRCPTLVLHARHDALVPFEQGRLVAGLIPEARFVPLESRNHILLESEPAWRRFTAEIDKFLAETHDVSLDAAVLLLHELTPREREVLDAIARGFDNATIAKRLGISDKTVRNHVSLIFGKLGVNRRAEAIVRARDAGLGRGALP